MTLAEISSRHAKPNKIEKMKVQRSPMEAWRRLEEYAAGGYDSIPSEDLSYFLKSFGIYDRPATPGRFMLRVRIPGGRLRAEQAELLGDLSREYGRDVMDLTTRAQVQLRHLRIEDLPTLLRRMEEVGISSWQTGVDNFRNIVTDPLDRLAYDSIIHTAPIIRRLQELWLGREEWVAALPRKFNTAISGTMTNRCNLFAHDCCFALANREGEYGFNVYLGGKVGAVAQSADTFLRIDEVLPFYQALIETYREFGFRDSRNKNRLYYLIREVGVFSLMAAVKDRAGREFAPAGETLVKEPRTEERDGRIRLRDGGWAVRALVPAGIFSGSDLREAGRLAERYGSGLLNLSTTQDLYLLGIKEENLSALLSEEFMERYPARRDPYHNQLVACAGSEVCPFGVIPNKPDALEMAEYLEREVPLPADASIRMHWSGCVKGCGLHGLGDIGFVGCKVREEGQSVGGVHILLGGKATTTQEEASALLKSVPLSRAGEYTAQLARAYREGRRPRESFERFESRVLRRYSKGALEFILRWNVRVAAPGGYDPLRIRADWQPNIEHNEIFILGERIYKKLCGVRPYQGTHLYAPIEKTPPVPLHRRAPEISRELSAIVMRMIAPSSKRYQVFTELIKDLEKIGYGV